MEWFLGALRSNPEITFFLTLALGYALGSVRLGTFSLGPVLGTLIVGLAVGQIGVNVSGPMQAAFFLMFLFAIGFRTGPEFFQGLRSSALPQVTMTALLSVCALGCTWGLAKLCGFDGGTAAGLLAGAQTSSTALGTATQAAAGLGLDAEHAAAVAHNVATGYALTYFLGTLLVVWFLPAIGPRLMRVNLADACRQLEQQMGLQTSDPNVGSAYREFVVRAYRLAPSLAGRTVAQLEALWPPNSRVIVGRVRRGDALIEALPAMELETGDVLAVAGRQDALLAADAPLRDEVLDRELLAVPTVSADLVLTNRRMSGQTLSALGQEVVARGVFLRKLRRAGRELPFTAQTVVERGDVMTVAGSQREVERLAGEVGYAEYASSTTDLMVVAATIAVGALIGLPSLRLGPFAVGLSAPVGVLLAGLALGHLRTVYPRLGRIPDASVALLESFGLAGFLALVGLGAGPGLIAAFKEHGAVLVGAGVVVTLLPHVVAILVGRYAMGMHPGILLGVCAGAGTSAPALAEIEKAARSKIPTLGYGMACAVGNVLLALWGTILVQVVGR
jgi:putative transport protein